MSDGEIIARISAIDDRVRAGFEEIRGDLHGLTAEVEHTNGSVRMHELWIAKAQGFGAALAIVTAAPSVILAVIALREVFK